MKDMGEVDVILSTKIIRANDQIILSQSQLRKYSSVLICLNVAQCLLQWMEM